MAAFRVIFQEKGDMPVRFSEDENISVRFGETKIVETGDYEKLRNKPRINDIELAGNKTSEQLKLQHQMLELSESDIDDILYGR